MATVRDSRLFRDRCTISDGDQGDHVANALQDPLRPEHHLLPGEAQGAPPGGRQLGVAHQVPDEGVPATVGLEAVSLDDDAQVSVGQIDPPDPLPTTTDAYLRLEAGDA